MQIQVKSDGEVARNDEIITAPVKGSHPRVRFIILYLPILCIIYPANREPEGVAMLFGTKCQPVIIMTIKVCHIWTIDSYPPSKRSSS